MIDLEPTIARIKALLAEDTDASITYAALEARLGLEKVCYERLRQRHDYISHAQLQKWQPGAVVNTLIQEVDPHVAQTMIFSIGKSPAVEGVKPEDDDYEEIGTEIGFDPKKVAKLWNALAKLALHVRLPEGKDDHISEFGDKSLSRAKVEEVVAELERLAQGTMSFSGIGMEVSFTCSCGEKNKRRAELLKDGQHIHCINPECKITWKAVMTDGDFVFEDVTVPVNCDRCKVVNLMPWRHFHDMKYDQSGTFFCHSCRHKNYVQWRLTQMSLEDGPKLRR